MPSKTIICGVAPGWIFAGRLESEDEVRLVLAPALWVKSLSAPWPEAAVNRKKITESSSIPRLEIRQAAVLWVADCAESVVGAEALAALEKR